MSRTNVYKRDKGTVLGDAWSSAYSVSFRVQQETDDTVETGNVEFKERLFTKVGKS